MVHVDYDETALKNNMLNTNADTIAGETAKALSALFDVTLV